MVEKTERSKSLNESDQASDPEQKDGEQLSKLAQRRQDKLTVKEDEKLN